MPEASLRAELVEKLGSLLPDLKGKVHLADYENVRFGYEALSQNPDAIPDWVRTYPRALRETIKTDKDYAIDPSKRQNLEHAANLLEQILNLST